MAATIDKYTVRMRVRDTRGDNVKATTIKEKKGNICLLYMNMFSSQNLI